MVNFEHISLPFLVFLLLTLTMYCLLVLKRRGNEKKQEHISIIFGIFSTALLIQMQRTMKII